MGNACGGFCSEGGQTTNSELANYASGQGRPVNQSVDSKGQRSANFGGHRQGNENDILLAYTSGD